MNHVFTKQEFTKDKIELDLTKTIKKIAKLVESIDNHNEELVTKKDKLKELELYRSNLQTIKSHSI
jgi:hypothetical protein